MKITYDNGYGKTEERDVVEGLLQSLLRKLKIGPKLPVLRQKAEEITGQPVEVRLFGSVSQNMATSNSDTDVIVILPPDTTFSGYLSADYHLSARKRTIFGQEPVDLVVGIKDDSNPNGFVIKRSPSQFTTED